MTTRELKEIPLTYISLFSGAGVGCYGFHLEQFECIATNEISERRLNIQRYNNKCRYNSGYILGDLVSEDVKSLISKELMNWRENHKVRELDVLIATPPCQGMSVANHKKNNELSRNSLVVESIKMVTEFNPKFFVFENVRSFLSSICTDTDLNLKPIRESIELNLGGKYNIGYKVINFKNYGNPSSRTRTIVIGVRKDLYEITPLDFMPTLQKQHTVRQTIGHLPSLGVMGEIDANDVFHNFRNYSDHMRSWIEFIGEGESAFDNCDLTRQPHRVIDGKVVLNAKKNGDKYTRCQWDKPGACVHTRNDILSSQSTIHPSDDRVFSVRELMHLMSIPSSFQWCSVPERVVNRFSDAEKRKLIKKEELNIRQTIGESVPTIIFQNIAQKINNYLATHSNGNKGIKSTIRQFSLNEPENLKEFLSKNLGNFSFSELSRIVEYSNLEKSQHAAYYTRQDICYTIVKDLPGPSRFSSIRILEPSVGVGNFLPLLIEKYKEVPRVIIDVVDIDKNALDILKVLIGKLNVPTNIKINFLNKDFLLNEFSYGGPNERKQYDIVVGNPPFGKIVKDSMPLQKYRKQSINKTTNNLFAFFLEKAVNIANFVALVVPKSFLSSPEFDETREFVSKQSIKKIIDYGEKGFEGVRIETISLLLEAKKPRVNNTILVESYIKHKLEYKNQSYIHSQEYPYWLIYRNSYFDRAASKLKLGVFVAFRDRQITKKITKEEGKIRVLKSRNIRSNAILNIPNYDAYIDDCENLSISKFINYKNAVLVPNLTYYPRACFLPEDTIGDGSVAILVPKYCVEITEEDLKYYNSEEFTEFYRVARNFGTRSLNIDRNSVFFFGLLKAHKTEV